jgi:hypothetical protein
MAVTETRKWIVAKRMNPLSAKVLSILFCVGRLRRDRQRGRKSPQSLRQQPLLQSQNYNTTS